MVKVISCERCGLDGVVVKLFKPANRYYHYCEAAKDHIFENGDPVLLKPQPPKPAPCELCTQHGGTDWELGAGWKWFHWCESMNAFRYEDGHCDFQSTEEVVEDPAHPYSAQSRPCTDCTSMGHEPNWQHDPGSNLYFHYCKRNDKVWENGKREITQPPGYVPPGLKPNNPYRHNSSQRLDNCGWVTLAALLRTDEVHLMTTSNMYKVLAQEGIVSPKMDGLALPEDIFKVAEEFGTIDKIVFFNATSQGIPSKDLPSSGVPQGTDFATSVYTPGANLAHVVLGYWMPCDPKTHGGKTIWFRFTDFQPDTTRSDVSSWVMQPDKLIRWAYWFRHGGR